MWLYQKRGTQGAAKCVADALTVLTSFFCNLLLQDMKLCRIYLFYMIKKKNVANGEDIYVSIFQWIISKK